MRVKANNKIYDFLEYTNNKKKIEDFMGEDTVVQTRIKGIGFTAEYNYVVDTTHERVCFYPGTRILRDQNGDTFWINNDAYIALFGKKGKK